MANNKDSSISKSQRAVALWVLGFSGLVLLALGTVAVIADSSQAMNIFNGILPVVASWVGTVLAYYFGRENFESANQQVRELVQRISPDQLAKSPVISIMRPFTETVHYKIPEGKDDNDIPLSDIMKKFDGKNVTRVPVVTEGNKPKYMIHESRISKYIAGGGSEKDSLAKFIDAQRKANVEFGESKGFIVVAEQSTIAEAKFKMEAISGCQDVFVSKNGTADEPLTGWISNMRLGKYLEA